MPQPGTAEPGPVARWHLKFLGIRARRACWPRWRLLSIQPSDRFDGAPLPAGRALPEQRMGGKAALTALVGRLDLDLLTDQLLQQLRLSLAGPSSALTSWKPTS